MERDHFLSLITREDPSIDWIYNCFILTNGTKAFLLRREDRESFELPSPNTLDFEVIDGQLQSECWTEDFIDLLDTSVEKITFIGSTENIVSMGGADFGVQMTNDIFQVFHLPVDNPEILEGKWKPKEQIISNLENLLFEAGDIEVPLMGISDALIELIEATMQR